MEEATAINLDIEPGDALLIVPPFASTNMPYLGVHVLQACARKEGFEVKVLYANLMFASLIGEARYESLCRSPVQCMLGERLFTAAAYGMRHLGKDDFIRKMKEIMTRFPDKVKGVNLPELVEWSKLAASWSDRMGEAVGRLGFRVVGCTTTFEQTAPSVALLSRIKRCRPETIAIIGGANCEGEMAQGMLSLCREVDYVFSGESESSFPGFLRDSLYALPSDRIVKGEACPNLDQIPPLDLSEFYAQRKLWLEDGRSEQVDGLWISYETSRGCWWGEKRQCTFCGLNGENMAYRQKSADRVLADLQTLTEAYAIQRICMTDNNMPFAYFKTLLPRIAETLPGLEIFYELKANLSLDAVQSLKKAGITMIQPGIESLSTSCLKLMGKGVTARQNLNLLRHARSTGIGVSWNVLYALPGDRLDEYQKMLELIPLLRHLQPPLGVSHLSLERFSRYFVHPDHYDIAKLRPLPVYGGIFPKYAAAEKLAYHFTARYPSESGLDAEFMERFEQAVEAWRESWRGEGELPTLALTDLGGGRYLLLDTRGIQGNREMSFLSEDEAMVALTGTSTVNGAIEWAKQRKLAVDVDGVPMPLVTAEPALFKRIAPAPPP